MQTNEEITVGKFKKLRFAFVGFYSPEVISWIKKSKMNFAEYFNGRVNYIVVLDINEVGQETKQELKTIFSLYRHECPVIDLPKLLNILEYDTRGKGR